MKDISDSHAKIAAIEATVPTFFARQYQKKSALAGSSFNSKKPDFQGMADIVARVADTSFWGYVKRLIKFGGYKLTGAMLEELATLASSARSFLTDESANAKISAARAEADAKAEIQRLKNEADAKKQDFAAQNQRKLDAGVSSLRGEIARLIGGQEVKNLDRDARESLEKLGAFEASWKKYSPAKDYPSEIMLGAIKVPFKFSQATRDDLKRNMPFAFSSGESLVLPLTFSAEEPLLAQIIYDQSQKNAVMTGVQSVILKLIRFMPLFSFNLTYIDPNDRGTNLGLLIKLAMGGASDIIKKAVATKEDIAKRLKDLEAFVDKTSAILAGFDSVYSYNKSREPKLPFHFVAINDFPDNFERGSLETLNVLLKNSKKCGISFIFTSPRPLDSQISSNLTIRVNSGGGSVALNRKTYDFGFVQLISGCDSFIDSVNNAYADGVKVDNRFAAFFDLNKPTRLLESTDGVQIPFAVDSAKRLVSLELGGPQSVNALLSGRTGSGKSTTLHTLISSIALNYHPDDVELWLVDYKKVEFAEYIENTPPHVRLIGLERDPEFTYSLLDKLNEEFTRRVELFKQQGVSSIKEFKQKFGVRSLPRVIFIVDEFHQMTQAISNNPKYVQILENILSEFRAFGLSCAFSDQAITDGLRGLTEKGRKQISVRIAMENDRTEVAETLALDRSFYDEAFNAKIMKMKQGDVIFKRFSGAGDIILDTCKTIFIDKNERIAIARKAVRETGGNYGAKDALIVDGQKRRARDEKAISLFESKIQLANPSKSTLLHIGTPVTLDPCFYIPLVKKTDSNVMVIGSDDELRVSILINAIKSFKRAANASVRVFAYETDEIYRQYRAKISAALGPKDGILTDLYAISQTVENARLLMSHENDKRVLLCWLGLEEIADEYSVCPDKSSAAAAPTLSQPSARTSALDALTRDIDSLLGVAEASAPGGLPNDPSAGGLKNELYNACPYIQELFAKGSRFNVYSIVTFSSVKMIRQAKCVKPDNFEHKIALKMTLEDSVNYLGRGEFGAKLDGISAAYYDGSGVTRTFRPYLL
ncbi:MAG: hypothetical protein LBO66_00845 [Deltaproteobacteria bacterium]|nr:hypothetical protein [Deltaproteobacteria bacterium]